MELLFSFPLPNFGKYSECLKLIDASPLCYCCQHTLHSDGYGPYGFDSKLGRRITSVGLKEFSFWSFNGDFSDNFSRIQSDGIYLLKSSASYEDLTLRYREYVHAVKKNQLLIRRQMPIHPLPEIPLLANLFHGGCINVSVLNQLLEVGVEFFFLSYYTPAAGDTIISFSPFLDCSIERLAIESAIECRHVDSIDRLKDW